MSLLDKLRSSFIDELRRPITSVVNHIINAENYPGTDFGRSQITLDKMTTIKVANSTMNKLYSQIAASIPQGSGDIPIENGGSRGTASKQGL